jgi:acyl-CoA hydrolase
MQAKRVSESFTVMTEMIMPNDTNPLGNLMGGNLMRWMDIAGGICAARHANKDVVTVSVDHVSFQKPIHTGDVITLQACVTRAFSTSIEIYVEVFAAGMKGDNQRKCNDAYLTFVALNEDNMKPCSVPPVLALTGEEQDRYDGALRRRELRLVLGGRMKVQDATNLKALFVGE